MIEITILRTITRIHNNNNDNNNNNNNNNDNNNDSNNNNNNNNKVKQFSTYFSILKIYLCLEKMIN